MEPRRLRPAFKGYGVPDTEEGMLAWGWAAERLESARNYWVATTRPDGRPHSMPVWGIWLDGAFYFGSGPQLGEVAEPRREPGDRRPSRER